MFTPWEKATNLAPASRKGMVDAAATWPLTGLAALVILVLLWPQMGWAAMPVALVFGRMLALDLTTYTLPNIYTIPLVAMGLAHAWRHNEIFQALIALLLILLFAETLKRGGQKIGQNMGMGGGDLKLLAALFAFMPLSNAFFAVALGSLVWLPVAFLKPKAMIPFGVPLIIGWVLLLRFAGLPNWLVSTIS